MSAYSREILLATSVLCGSSGAMNPLQLYRKLLQRCSITEEEFWRIILRCPRFQLVRGPAEGGAERLEDCSVVARTSLRLCSRYGREECSGFEQEEGGECQQLHLCKFFVYGNCRFGKGRLVDRTHSGVSGRFIPLISRSFLSTCSGNCLFSLLWPSVVVKQYQTDALLNVLLNGDYLLCSLRRGLIQTSSSSEERRRNLRKRSDDAQKSCKFSHNIHSDHNYRLLRECTLHELHEDDLFVLLLQNDPSLLPKVCLHYNKGSGPHGYCTFQESCTKVHLCQHFVRGDCIFGPKCKRQHAIDQHGRRMLEERGLSGGVIQELPFIYRNIHHLTAGCTENLPESLCKPQTDDRNICLHSIRGSCKFQNECRHVHFHLPYKWEVFDGITWTDLPHMEDIERDFCDPSKTQSCGDEPVDFLTMSRELQPIRRLSTVSSVTKPPHYTLTTQWLWYYKGDQGNWVEYGLPDEKQRSTSVSSQTLEEAFLSGSTAEVKVMKGQRQYIISFKDMYQRNPKHNTKRRVRRRPCFVSMAEVEKQAVT
uniref:protein mono-ADP-ribosyltransferase PARP12b isoform X1 n=1 Tax=Scatophagus argus TaxID=75038 RepID=UPI001ED82BCE|nr:protein mono-ADP-ribosyltransferase PARP12b isoform X1 [Scatophagus argus]XP_046234808.1 protein mono-ADP-ribosyltransferase PARP12b isoform X1 [Scatophagus argus]